MNGKRALILGMGKWEASGMMERLAHEDPSKSMGRLLYETHGKSVGMKVLPDGRIERTFMARGTRDQDREEYTTTWTITLQLAPDGTVHGELNGFFITASREIVRYVGMGNGLMNADGSMAMRGTVSYLNPTGKYARYSGMTVVWEFEVDKEGNMNNKGWEWK